jgi:uncharacterized protein YdhG (YjbR/CyaY superfamily)
MCQDCGERASISKHRRRLFPVCETHKMPSTTMKTAAPENVAAYIAGFPRPVQTVLKRVRSIVRRAIPGADEAISYRIPTYKLHGRPVLYFAAFKGHYSVYPSNPRLVAAFKDKLERYERSKGTIRFPLSEPVPVKLIEAIAKFRAKEVGEAEKARAAKRKQ